MTHQGAAQQDVRPTGQQASSSNVAATGDGQMDAAAEYRAVSHNDGGEALERLQMRGAGPVAGGWWGLGILFCVEHVLARDRIRSTA